MLCSSPLLTRWLCWVWQWAEFYQESQSRERRAFIWVLPVGHSVLNTHWDTRLLVFLFCVRHGQVLINHWLYALDSFKRKLCILRLKGWSCRSCCIPVYSLVLLQRVVIYCVRVVNRKYRFRYISERLFKSRSLSFPSFPLFELPKRKPYISNTHESRGKHPQSFLYATSTFIL